MWKQKSIVNFFPAGPEQDGQNKRRKAAPGGRPAKLRKLSCTEPNAQETEDKEAKETRVRATSSTSERGLEKRHSQSTAVAGEPESAGVSSAASLALAAGAQKSAETNERLTAASERERFKSRAVVRFPFLQPEHLQDASGKQTTDIEYDPRTLHVPPQWFKAAKVSEGQRQWWQFKASHFDSVLLFKMGKFYEMFEMDAHIGVEVLGLIYMKGEQPHCGFPESKYHDYAGQLARAGHRVVVVEQTETPEQLRVRNEQRRAAGLSKVGIVNREVVAVLTQGTLTDPEMLDAQHDASYIWCLTETILSGSHHILGACAVDCATGEMLVGSWEDDDLRTTLRAHLAALRPVEVVIPTGVGAWSLKILKANMQAGRINKLQAGRDFWTAAETISYLETKEYYQGHALEPTSALPDMIQALRNKGQKGEVAIGAIGGAVSFLRSALLDESVVSLGKVRALTYFAASASPSGSANESDCQHVALDGAALQNLEVFEAIDGGSSGTLLSTLDACSTAAGRRTLKKWLCCPLGRAQDILARQEAVQLLMTDASLIANSARTSLAGIGDLERSIARLCASSLGGIRREASSVVFYEDSGKRRVTAFIAALKGLQQLQEVMATFKNPGVAHSDLLSEITTPGSRLPEIARPLEGLLQAAEWDIAAEEGRVIPKQGIDPSYDLARSFLTSVDEKLDRYLEDAMEMLGSRRGVSYISFLKDSHVLEITEDLLEQLASHIAEIK